MEVVIYKDKGKLIYENLNEMNNYLILIILLFCITGCKEKRPAIKEAVLTSSLRTPKFFVKEFSYFLMPCHQHGLRINLLVQR